MRVLWLCNIMLPAFAKQVGMPFSNREGWLTGSFERLIREPARSGSSKPLVELGVCCPVPLKLDEGRYVIDGVTFYSFHENLDTPEIYDPSLETVFSNIIRDFKPDMVHIFGTEFPHALAMARAFDEPDRTMVGIQGLCCSIADAYMADLPYSVQKRSTFRDRWRHDSLMLQQKKFYKRAHNEELLIERVMHITGRTSFDRRVTSRINPQAMYHKVNETLRPQFYNDRWDRSRVEPYSIFLSQGDYPLKGFHYMLQAMPAILVKFPEAHLYVAGNSIIGNQGGVIKEKKKYPTPLWITSYGQYLKSLIREYHLEDHVTMLGKLDAEQMKDRFLKSHTFVCPSVLENSPNSLCEAMLLGMPVIAAKVGGIGDLVNDGEEGILFPSGRYNELAEGVKTIFYDDTVAGWLGENAAQAAKVRHNPDTNFRRLLEVYRSITG